MLNSIMHDYPDILLSEHEPPCLSLYQPTHRQHPDNEQDPIRFRNLVKTMEGSLQQKYPSREIKPLLTPFYTLADDRAFWNHTLDGLAILAGPKTFSVYKVQRPVAELVVVADSFHTKPLMRIVQSADRYQILALSRHAYKIYEGNRDRVDELFSESPQEIEAVLETELGGRERATRTYGPARTTGLTRHGTDVRQDAIDSDTVRFFRAVDRAVEAHYSRPAGLPLLLAALPEHHSLFRQVSRNPALMPEALNVHPDDLSPDALREQAWTLVLPYYLQRLEGLLDAFNAARTKGGSSDDLSDIARAAVGGRVATLLIEADRLIPGTVDQDTGAIAASKLSDPAVDDLLDDIGERVLRARGEVVIVPADRMPSQSGLAAIYRY